MSHFYIPTTSPENWQHLLAEPDKHWKRGYSARSLAYCWETEGFPREIKQLLLPKFPDMELLLALPEHKTPLPGGKRASQTDLFVLGKSGGQLVTIAVEGKVAEPFGPSVAEWLRNESSGKQSRLSFLCELLGLSANQVLSTRYQLLHRSGAALLEARRFNAAAAVMLVHSFSPDNAWLEDYLAFLKLLGVEGGVNTLSFVRQVDGVALYLGWAKGNPKYLEM